MLTVVLTHTPTFYVDPLPTRCLVKNRPYEAAAHEEAEGHRQALKRQFPDCTYEVQPVSSAQDEVIHVAACLA